MEKQDDVFLMLRRYKDINETITLLSEASRSFDRFVNRDKAYFDLSNRLMTIRNDIGVLMLDYNNGVEKFVEENFI